MTVWVAPCVTTIVCVPVAAAQSCVACACACACAACAPLHARMCAHQHLLGAVALDRDGELTHADGLVVHVEQRHARGHLHEGRRTRGAGGGHRPRASDGTGPEMGSAVRQARPGRHGPGTPSSAVAACQYPHYPMVAAARARSLARVRTGAADTRDTRG